ncbi:hypothetical protein AB0M12_16085 [Nocardia vinacea]|uniref:hypothetical protein n=1 Tax=Nocardia vinacea TaxID=96468 RepID=UPI00341F9863
MRLLLEYKTGDAEHQHADVKDETVKRVLGGLGWLSTNEKFAETKLKELLGRLPDAIREQVTEANPILIGPRSGTWGVVSHEKANRIHIRLLHDDLQTLRQEADKVVAVFPPAFKIEFNRDLGFEPEVVIRRFDNEDRLVAGVVQQLNDYGFWKYMRKERHRELVTLASLSLLTVATLGASIPMSYFTSGVHADYWRGFLDRFGSTFFTAALTILITVIIEYRKWVNARIRIKWAFDVPSSE